VSQTRRLAAILAADVVGYSRLMGADEEGTLERLKVLRHELLDPKIAEHKGRIVKTTGDGLLVEFGSVVDALRCAVEVQKEMAGRNAGAAPDSQVAFRIGLNVGDIVVEDGDIFGDGVNVAARLEVLAEPGGICVSARVQEDVAGKLDLAFDDIGEQQLKNIARPVRVYRVVTEARSEMLRPGTDPPLPDKPSIAVLPFANMSGDPEQEYFADGMVEEIITALSRIRWLFVIARNSSFTYKGQAVDVKQVGRELGVRYVLEGSVRKASQRVRITAQLIDAQSGTHLWADRVDGSLEDVFELQEQVAVSVAGVIEPTLQAAEAVRSASRPTADLSTYDLYLRALSDYGSLDKDRMMRALRLLSQAINRDPDYGPAIALASHVHQQLGTNGWAEDPESNHRASIALARRALRVAPDDPDVLIFAGFALGFLGENIDMAIGLIDRSLALNPSSAPGWLSSGLLRMFAGQGEIAIEHLNTSARLNPRQRFGSSGTGLGAAHFFARRFNEAAAILLAALQRAPDYAVTYRYLAACYAHMGQLDEARDIVKRLREITPFVLPSVVPFRKAEDRDLFLSGLRLALGKPV
jgi:adenylate cyclase